MSYTDFAKEARSYSSTAAAETRRAERDAMAAAQYYTRAANSRHQAADLTSRPHLWDPEFEYTPRHLEATAASWAKLADCYLRSSFRSTASAAFYRDLAARYRANRDRYQDKEI